MAILSDTTNHLGIRIVVSDDPVTPDPQLAVLRTKKALDRHVRIREKSKKTKDRRRADALGVRLAAGENIDLNDPIVWDFEV